MREGVKTNMSFEVASRLTVIYLDVLGSMSDLKSKINADDLVPLPGNAKQC